MMNKRIFTGMTASALLMSGCVIAIDGDNDADFATNLSYGTSWNSVYAADISGDGLTVTVNDNGCTTKAFFVTEVHHGDDNEFDVGLRRVREDYCKANNPDGVALTWSYAELGLPEGADVSLLNKVRR